MKIHLVDGTYELFRTYYGAPSQLDPKGREVGATRALLRSLWAMVQEPGVTHVACAFDHVIESFRNDLFPGYKTGDGIEPGLLNQFPLAERASAALGIVTWPMVEFEADDAIAAAAHRFAHNPQVEQVLICASDKDFAQCVRGTKVVMWDRMRGKVYDEDGVREKWGISPGSIPDWLALVGDTADGIPGVPKWGAKSAAAVLAAYGSIEAIPLQERDWSVQVRGAKALGETLREHREVLALYKTLATLRVDVPQTETLEQLFWRGVQLEALRELCTEIGDEGFLARVMEAAPH